MGNRKNNKKLVIKKEKLTVESFRIEKDMLEKLKNVSNELKNIHKSEVIRYAIDFCLENKQFMRFLKDLDNR